MTHEIIDRSEGRKSLSIVIDGYEVFSMTLGPVAPASHEWLAEILDRSFQEAIEKGVRRARAKDQAEMRRLLGIGG
jgi:hypothetical protein